MNQIKNCTVGVTTLGDIKPGYLAITFNPLTKRDEYCIRIAGRAPNEEVAVAWLNTGDIMFYLPAMRRAEHVTKLTITTENHQEEEGETNTRHNCLEVGRRLANACKDLLPFAHAKIDELNDESRYPRGLKIADTVLENAKKAIEDMASLIRENTPQAC